MGIPLESENARKWNMDVWKFIKSSVDEASKVIAREKGACPDAARHGFVERFSNKTSIAPTASISIICGGASPGIEPMAANAYTHKTLSGSFLVKNPYMESLLDKHGQNTGDVWSSIITSGGSVQHLEFLNESEKKIFRTGAELDQSWLIRHAADRAPFVDQAASNNLFFRPDAAKGDILRAHFMAWKEGVKSLYYCRSESLKQASAVGQMVKRKRIIEDAPVVAEEEKYLVCEACQ